MVYSRAEVAREFRCAIEFQLGVSADRLSGHATLSSLGLDFIGLRKLMNALEYRFDVRINRGLFSEAFTLDESIASLEHLINGGGWGEAVVPEGAD